MAVGRNTTGRVAETTRQKVATLRDTETDARLAVATGLDQFLSRTRVEEDGELRTKSDIADARAKLKAAGDLSEQIRVDLKDVTLALENRLTELGEQVKRSEDYQGFAERLQYALGTMGWKKMLDRAERNRMQRLDAMSMKDSLRQIGALVEGTVVELNQVVKQFQDDIDNPKTGYAAVIKHVVQKLQETTPKYQKAKADREAVEVEITSLERELESGVVEEKDRPQLEARHDQLQRELNQLRLQETDFLAVIQKAQEAIPLLKEARQAKDKSINAIRMMQQNIFEKFQNLKPLLEHAMTEVIAQAKMNRAMDVDPAFNFAIDAVMKNTIRTSGALMASAIERANKAAVTPEAAAAYAAEFRQYIEKYVEGIDKLEEMAARGGVYAGNGSSPDSQ